PAMNFLRFDGTVEKGDNTVSLNGQQFEIPTQLQGASGELVFGVRPEQVTIRQDSAYAGEVIAVEYLGTTQIITIDTANGMIKARASSGQIVKVGEKIGLDFNPAAITLFEKSTGRALVSNANQGVLENG
ncbi:MAG TPA: TOBE domain-containing protein, partial [Rhizobiales bacterium]|nr:TOBE domain-containing protein [Hyphomicrobiales bacterium]